MSTSFTPTRAAAWARLQEFLPLAGRTYQRDRNFDPPPADRNNVSMLSPYLRHRLVGEWEVLSEVLEHHSQNDAFKFIQELYWRTYFKGWLEQRPQVWSDCINARDPARRGLSGKQAQQYEQAINGNTGIEPLDTWSRELIDTGYLHNHARMWFASLWIFTLKLPWALGADFFYRHLLDGDPASNTLSWRWVAGLHTPGKTYLATPGNIAKYAQRFQQAQEFDAVFATSAKPVAGTPNPSLGELVLPATATIKPDTALLLHEDDLHLQWDFTPAATAAMAVTDTDIDSRVIQFRTAAVNDTLERVASSKWLEQLTDDTLLDWVNDVGVTRLAVPYIPIGHTRTAFEPVRRLLAENGIEITWLVRQHDRDAWPFATSGFFKVGKQIPTFLKKAGLVD